MALNRDEVNRQNVYISTLLKLDKLYTENELLPKYWHELRSVNLFTCIKILDKYLYHYPL